MKDNREWLIHVIVPTGNTAQILLVSFCCATNPQQIAQVESELDGVLVRFSLHAIAKNNRNCKHTKRNVIASVIAIAYPKNVESDR